MDLLEYQAKQLFREVGIPILPSQTIKDPRQIKQLKIPYPVVLKSQVKSGGRGKAGGVRFVGNTIDAIAAARTIFNLSILGELPEVILAEAHYNTKKEFFLAIVLDYQLKCPVLLGSAYGGMNIESLLSNLQQVPVEEEFSDFYARRLTANMGLSGKSLESVSHLIGKMYRLFHDCDLNLIEINPLGVNAHGELMALDGKITIDDCALARHPQVAALNFKSDRSLGGGANRQNLEVRDIDVIKTSKPRVKWLDWKEKKGKTAIITNSFDLALLTWDLACQRKAKPACAVVIENGEEPVPSSEPVTDYIEQLQQAIEELQLQPELKVILINIWVSEALSREIMQKIASYGQPLSESPTPVNASRQPNVSSLPQVKFVLRLPYYSDLESPQIGETLYVTTDLEAAISQTVTLIKSK